MKSPQGAFHVVRRHVVQGLEHEYGVEAGVRLRDGLGAAVTETHPRQIVDGQVLLMLDTVDLGGHQFRRPELLRQQAGHPGRTAAQFQYPAPAQVQVLPYHRRFVAGAVGRRVIELHLCALHPL